FTFVGAVFPVRGTHDFGGRGGRFGAGRSGHMHAGQDVMAGCGTPLVAARGGTVTMRARQALAGNYLVIHDEVSGQDFMYAHLRERALVKKGQRVETGQAIGFAGDTGDASACHLHFEIWTAPGWYAGGEPIDPLPSLRRWDAFS
ncbi:MAG: M23 family metallopeptidase, partial [Conexibacter sp.]